MVIIVYIVFTTQMPHSEQYRGQENKGAEGNIHYQGYIMFCVSQRGCLHYLKKKSMYKNNTVQYCESYAHKKEVYLAGESEMLTWINTIIIRHNLNY
jgi:hypothetical protein